MAETLMACSVGIAGSDFAIFVRLDFSNFGSTSTLVAWLQNLLLACMLHRVTPASHMKTSFFWLGKRKIGLCQNDDANGI